MGTYAQWRAGGSKTARVVHVSGPSGLLRDEVVRQFRERYPAPAETFYAGYDEDVLIWTAAATYPADPDEQRLIVVHNAERIRRWEALPELLAAHRAMAGCCLLLASAESDYPPAESAHGALLRKSTQALLIRCTPPGGAELESWAAAQLPEHSRKLAADVIYLTGSELERARDLCAKVSVLPAPATRAMLVWLAGDAGGDYAWNVVSGERDQAATIARYLTRAQLGYALGTLHGWLDDLAILAPAVARKASMREINGLGVREFSARRLLPVAVRYTPDRIRSCRRVLLDAFEAYRAGQQAGVAEAVAVLW